MRIQFDGHTYTKDEIEDLRKDLIVYRDRALDSAPEGFQMAVVLSHTIAILHKVKDEVDD